MCAPINILWPVEDQFLEGGDQGQVCAQSCSVGIYFSMLKGEKNKVLGKLSEEPQQCSCVVCSFFLLCLALVGLKKLLSSLEEWELLQVETPKTQKGLIEKGKYR